jgi:hypothetical protein
LTYLKKYFIIKAGGSDGKSQRESVKANGG